MGAGLIPGGIDLRDYLYKKTGTTKNNIDLSAKTGPVLNQGNSNACTAFAVGELLDYFFEHKKKGVFWKGFKTSKLYLWYHSRLMEGSQGSNSGVILRDVFKAIKKYGFVTEELYPFSNNWYESPPDKTLLSGDFFKLYLATIPEYYAIPTYKYNFHSLISNCLTNDTPVILGFPIRSELDNANTANWQINTYEGTFRGYHAMLITGETDDYYIVKNSWGTNWGKQGYVHINKNLVKQLGIDLWTLK